jgi:transcriptional antiterminator
MPLQDYVLLKVFNNNVILTQHAGKEKIVIKQGIGFGKRPGAIIDKEIKFDKVFTLENTEIRDRFKQLMQDVDDNIIGICEEIIYMIDSEIGAPLDEEVHIRITDHIAFTIYRLKRNDEIKNPFIVEIETLYPEEMRLAKKAINMLEKALEISIAEDEIGFIALHIHSARGRGKVSNTLKYAYLTNSIAVMIEDELGMAVDRRSIDYARLVSHIRFALERMVNDIPMKNDLLPSIKKIYKTSFKLAKKIAVFIEGEIENVKVSEEEMGYLAMHIERIKNAAMIQKNFVDRKKRLC